MKKFILLSLIIISLKTFAQNKALKVAYQVYAKQSKEKPVLKETFLLFINNHKSLFINQNKIISDSLFTIYFNKMKHESKNSHVINLRNTEDKKTIKKYKYKLNWIVEKDFKNNQLTLQQKAFMSRIRYTQDLPHLAWKLQDSVKTILGYTVKKALLHYKGRDYVAWYAPSVAVSDGPYKFWGLPGLIFEIYDVKNDYHFLITGIEVKDNIVFPKDYFPKGSSLMPLVKTTEKNFNKDFNKTFNINNIVGNTVIIGQDRDEYAKERIKKIKALYDNPIELNED